jgi:hypothetical protein
VTREEPCRPFDKLQKRRSKCSSVQVEKLFMFIYIYIYENVLVQHKVSEIICEISCDRGARGLAKWFVCRKYQGRGRKRAAPLFVIIIGMVSTNGQVPRHLEEEAR